MKTEVDKDQFRSDLLTSQCTSVLVTSKYCESPWCFLGTEISPESVLGIIGNTLELEAAWQALGQRLFRKAVFRHLRIDAISVAHQSPNRATHCSSSPLPPMSLWRTI